MIPLFGLPQKVNILRKGVSEDSAGGLVEGTVSTIYTSRKCRISRLTEVLDFLQPFGYDSSKLWKFVFEYSPNIANFDYIYVNTVPYTTGNYRIVWYQHQQDHNGIWHHTSVIAEIEQ